MRHTVVQTCYNIAATLFQMLFWILISLFETFVFNIYLFFFFFSIKVLTLNY